MQHGDSGGTRGRGRRRRRRRSSKWGMFRRPAAFQRPSRLPGFLAYSSCLLYLVVEFLEGVGLAAVFAKMEDLFRLKAALAGEAGVVPKVAGA